MPLEAGQGPYYTNQGISFSTQHMHMLRGAVLMPLSLFFDQKIPQFSCVKIRHLLHGVGGALCGAPLARHKERERNDDLASLTDSLKDDGTY